MENRRCACLRAHDANALSYLVDGFYENSSCADYEVKAQPHKLCASSE